jgi:hypothetical protein
MTLLANELQNTVLGQEITAHFVRWGQFLLYGPFPIFSIYLERWENVFHLCVPHLKMRVCACTCASLCSSRTENAMELCQYLIGYPHSPIERSRQMIGCSWKTTDIYEMGWVSKFKSVRALKDDVFCTFILKHRTDGPNSVYFLIRFHKEAKTKLSTYFKPQHLKLINNFHQEIICQIISTNFLWDLINGKILH